MLNNGDRRKGKSPDLSQMFLFNPSKTSLDLAFDLKAVIQKAGDEGFGEVPFCRGHVVF